MVSCKQEYLSESIHLLIKCLHFSCLLIVPSGAPLNPSVLIVDSESINISWYPPAFEHQNGVIVYYVVSVVEATTNNVSGYVSYSTTLHLPSLHPHYQYNIKIAAVTTAQGPYTEEIIIQMPEDGKRNILKLSPSILKVIYSIQCIYSCIFVLIILYGWIYINVVCMQTCTYTFACELTVTVSLRIKIHQPESRQNCLLEKLFDVEFFQNNHFRVMKLR